MRERKFGVLYLAALLSSVLLWSVPESMGQEKTFDLIIKNAVVFDGVAEQPYRADIGISGPMIAAVGELNTAAAREVVNADGLYALPGFIDAHTHSDFNPLVYPGLPNKLMQGVTTEIAGNCGMSAAPALGPHRNAIAGIWAREGVVIPENLPWATVEEYQRVLNKKGLLTNLAVLVGHGNLRSAVMGFDARPAAPAEIKRMKVMMRQAMQEGASGVSFGLVYLPGIFAEEEEIAELCRVVKEFNGVCAFHMRSEGARLVESVQEVLRIGRKTGAKIQISHLKASGQGSWEKIERVFTLIENARREGIQVLADAYPYEAGYAELGVVLPDELYKRADRVQLFRDPSRRGALHADLSAYYNNTGKDWRTVMVGAISGNADRSYEGRTIDEIAASEGRDPVSVLIDLLADSAFEVSAFYFSQNPRIVETVLSQPYVALGSDSVADGSGYPHPRAFGSFPKLLRKTLDESQNSQELARWIRKVTSETADHFGLRRRGRLKAGYYADIVLWDPASTSDQATYQNPAVLASGASWVFINGVAAVRDGVPAPVRPGTFVRT